MERAFDAKEALRALTAFQAHQQLAVGAACCERMLPNYARFMAEERWGDMASLRAALDLIWDACLRGRFVQIDTANCETAIPDGDDFSSVNAATAQEAAISVCALSGFLTAQDPQHVVRVFRLSTDSVDLVVQEQEAMDPRDPLLEHKILRHPLMQQELVRQCRDMTDALRLGVGQEADLLAFRQRAVSECNLILA